MGQPTPEADVRGRPERERLYRALFESTQDGFCVVEMVYDDEGSPVDFRLIETNPAFERHTGLVGPVGMTARDLVPDMERHWVETYGRVAETGEAERFVEESPALGRWFDVEAFRVGEPEQRRVAILFRDITQQTRTEEELRKAEWRLKQSLQTSGQGSWSLDRATRTLRLDRAAASILGRPVEAVRTDEALTWLHPADREEFRTAIRRGIETFSQTETVVRVIRPDGARRWVKVCGRVYENSESLALGVVQDVTADVEAATDLESANRELEGQVEARRREIVELANALVRAEESERRRIAHVLHEDLQQVLAGARWMAHASGDPDLVEALGRALTLTKTLAHELDPPLGDEDLAPLLTWTAEQCLPLYGLVVAVDAPGDLALRDPDLRTLLHHALRELLFNVSKHAGVDHAVVRARARPEGIEVTVEDEGAGTDGDREGAGIGIGSLERRLANVGGRLRFESVPGDGTRVTVCLPLGAPPGA